MIGYMAMPVGFEYKDVFKKGRPVHKCFDPFRLKHPAMGTGHWAKIFAPFDALEGFDDAVAAKEVLYEFKRELGDDEKEELDRRLGILHRLTFNMRMARENQVSVTITYYIPCTDKDSFSYGYRGRYVTETGILWKIGMNAMTVDTSNIPLADIVDIESSKTVDGRNIFDFWEGEAS